MLILPHRHTPVRISSAVADVADLENVVLTRGEAVDRHCAGVGEEAAALPRAFGLAGGREGVVDFKDASTGDRG